MALTVFSSSVSLCVAEADYFHRGFVVSSTAMTDDDAIGCYGDSFIDRVFSDKLVDRSGMSPEVRMQFFVCVRIAERITSHIDYYGKKSIIKESYCCCCCLYIKSRSEAILSVF